MNSISAFLVLLSVAVCQTQSVPLPLNTSTYSVIETTTTPASSYPSTNLESEVETSTQTSPTPESISATNDVLLFGDHVIFILSDRLTSLPPEMLSVGEKILADTTDGVKSCENEYRKNGIIWEYKVCCSSYLRYGMSAFAGLSAESIRSGAARPSLLF